MDLSGSTTSPATRKWWSVLPLALLAALAGAIVLLSVRPGMGVIVDSVIYIEAADSLQAGQGLAVPTWKSEPARAPLTHFPPLLPVLLAALGKLGLTTLGAAAALNAACLALAAVLLALLVRFATGQNWLGMLAGTFLAVSPRLLDVHVSLLSEPLFLVLMLGAFLLLAVYLNRPSRGLLLAAAVLAGLSIMARYVGVVVVAAGSLCLLVCAGRTWKRRLGDTALFALLAALPLVAWFLRNKMLAGSAANRQAAFHPVGLEKVLTGMEAVGRWFVPEFLPSLVRVATGAGILLAAAMAILLLGSVRPKKGEPAAAPTGPLQRTMGLLLVFAVGYWAFLLLSISLLDAHTPLDNRILIPLLPVLAGLLACLVQALPLIARFRPLLPLLTLVLLGLAAVQARQLSGEIRSRDQAEGFASRSWTHGPIMIALRNPQLPLVPIYSNWPDAIRYATGRAASMLPQKTNPYSLRPNQDLEKDLARMEDDLAEGALVVHFAEPGRKYLIDRKELLLRLPLRPLMESGQGMIYDLRPPAGAASQPASGPAAGPASLPATTPATLPASAPSR